jgi:nickel/cobalt transporter (NicO) family protein
MSVAAALLLGLGMGVKHALEADHLAAVCTLVAGDGSVTRAAKVGALWGIGHGAVIVLAGGLLVAMGASVPAPIALGLDIAVALMLIALGAAALRSLMLETAQPALAGAGSGGAGAGGGMFGRPLAVGLLHGASGTAALTLLVASTITVRSHAVAFVVLFGLASIAGMALVAAAVAWPLRSAARRAPALMRMLRGLAGTASIAAGLAIAWSVSGSL